MIITIDGPSGTGKSSVSKRLAKALGFQHIDTGAMYRAFTYYCMKEGKDPLSLLDSFDLHTENERIFVNDEDITEEIRTKEVTNKSSEIAAIGEVRTKIVALQRATQGDAVFEGRDLGTVVFPKADVKIYLTATPEVRARRRFLQLGHLTEEEILRDQKLRDERDTTRKISPLRPADDAWILDTSELSLEEVVEKLVDYVKTIS